MRDMLDLLSDREIQSAAGARDIWQVIELVAARDLGGAANTARLTSAAVLRRHDTALAGHPGGRTGESVDGARPQSPASVTCARSPGASPAPSDHDLVQAVERWLAASA